MTKCKYLYRERESWVVTDYIIKIKKNYPSPYHLKKPPLIDGTHGGRKTLVRCRAMVSLVLLCYCIMWYVLFVVDEVSLSLFLFPSVALVRDHLKRDYSLNTTPLVK